MFFGLGKKGKTKIVEDEIKQVIDNGGDVLAVEGKEPDKKKVKDVKKLEVVVEVGDFIIKDNSIQEALGERFFAELKGNELHLSCADDCSSFSSFGSQTIIGNNNIMAGRSMQITQSGSNGIQTISHGGCSV